MSLSAEENAQMKKRMSSLPMAMITAMMLAQSEVEPRESFAEGQRLPRPEHWHKVQLSKSERMGKTPEEIQSLRRAKWEAQCRGR